jgi:hypothetical protein
MKLHAVSNPDLAAPLTISEPVFWQIQVTINQGVPFWGDIAQKDPDLAILHAPGRATMLFFDPGGLVASFREATLVENRDSTSAICRAKLFEHVGTQVIAHPIFIADRPGEQALHAIRSPLSGVFGHLPAIFAGDFAQHGLQVEQGLTAWFGSCETRSKTMMQVVQLEGPSPNVLERWSDFIIYGIVVVLHDFLGPFVLTLKCLFLLTECHIC